MLSRYQKIFIVNSLAGWVNKVFQIVYMVILTPVILSSLGVEKYGAWLLVGQFITYITMLDLGVGSSIARYYARYMAQDDALSNKYLYSTSRFILVMVGIVAFLITWFIRNGIASFYDVGESMSHDFITSLVLYGLCLSVTLSFYVFIGILQAYHKLYYVDFAHSISLLANFLGVLCLKFLGQITLTNLALVVLVSEIFRYLLMLIFARNLSAGVTKFSFKHVKWEMTKKIYSLGIASFLYSSLNTIRMQLPITLVGKVLGLSMVPVISIPLQILGNIGALASRPGTILTAVSSELDAVDKKGKIEFLNIEIARLLLFVTFAGALLIVFFSRPILTLWLKGNIDKDSLLLLSTSLSIMAVPFFVFVSLAGIKNSLMATGQHFRVVLTTTAITGGCFCLFFVLMGNVINVAYIISITSLAIGLYFVYQFSCYLNKSFLYILGSIFLRPLCFIILLVISFWLVKSLLSSELLKILSFCIMAILYLVLTMERKQRAEIWSMMSGFRIPPSERFEHK